MTGKRASKSVHVQGLAPSQSPGDEALIARITCLPSTCSVPNLVLRAKGWKSVCPKPALRNLEPVVA